MRYSLRTRLIVSLAAIVVVVVGLLVILTRGAITMRFNSMVHESGSQFGARISEFLGEYYARNGSWEGVGEIFVAFRNMPNNIPQPEHYPFQERLGFPARILNPKEERLLLMDNEGQVVFNSEPQSDWVDDLKNIQDEGVPIYVNGEPVGQLYVASSLGILNTLQNNFLSRMNTLMVFGGILAVLVAVVGGTYLAYRIITPVKALSEASLRLANGDYSQRIPVTSEDELGEMSKSFNKMAMELERQENLRRQAMADIAHELRTPLSVLQIDLESIEDGLVEPTGEAIQRLLMEVELLSKLVDDLRLLSLAEAGELRLDFHPVDLTGLVQVVLKRFDAAAREQGVELIFRQPGGELWISGDEQRLVQVLLNLLTNAVHYTPSGGQVAVEVEPSGEFVCMSIMDTGVGILQEDLPQVFERLYRADKARNRENGGSGLGLSIAKSIIDAHGGRIWAESKEGKGSTFAFELPHIPGGIEDPGTSLG